MLVTLKVVSASELFVPLPFPLQSVLTQTMIIMLDSISTELDEERRMSQFTYLRLQVTVKPFLLEE